jgi:hypothetical protein
MDGQISIEVPAEILVLADQLTFTSITTVTEDGSAQIEYLEA